MMRKIKLIYCPRKLDFKGTTRNNKQYYVVGKPLNWRDGDNVDLLISREINDDIMVCVKVVEQDPYLGVKIVHPLIDDDSKDIKVLFKNYC